MNFNDSFLLLFRVLLQLQCIEVPIGLILVAIILLDNFWKNTQPSHVNKYILAFFSSFLTFSFNWSWWSNFVANSTFALCCCRFICWNIVLVCLLSNWRYQESHSGWEKLYFVIFLKKKKYWFENVFVLLWLNVVDYWLWTLFVYARLCSWHLGSWRNSRLYARLWHMSA